MNYIILELLAQTMSFRHPNYQNFHKTLLLPPPTTLYGFVGAALGLSFKNAQAYFIEHIKEFGVHGTHNGKSNDLWKFIKRINKFDFYENAETNNSRDVLIREYLHGCSLLVFFGVNEKSIFNDLLKAFNSPNYALTLGNSDSLVKLNKISSFDANESISIIEKADTLSNCLYKGNVVKEILNKSEKNNNFSLYNTEAEMLPVQFKFDEIKKNKNFTGNYKRTAVKSDDFSFITSKLELNFKVDGIKYNQIFIPTIKLNL